MQRVMSPFPLAALAVLMLPLDQYREADGMTCVHAVVLVPHVPLAVLLFGMGEAQHSDT